LEELVRGTSRSKETHAFSPRAWGFGKILDLVTNPVLLRVLRPYPNADAYVAAESWSIDVKGMLLVNEAAHPAGTAVRFDVTLSNGEKVIRAEGVVVRHVAARGDRPAGLQVRFKRFGGTTKAFIDRVVAARAADRKPPRMTLPSLPEAPEPTIKELPTDPRASVTSLTPELTSFGPLPPRLASASGTPFARLRERRPGPVAAPADRDGVLRRLRQRAAG
jgi:hypothetical protein